MDNVPIVGSNITLAEGQDEYSTVRGRYDQHTPSIHAASGETYDSGPSITVAFKPTLEEALCLINGGHIYLRILGGGFPPVALWAE